MKAKIIFSAITCVILFACCRPSQNQIGYYLSNNTNYDIYVTNVYPVYTDTFIIGAGDFWLMDFHTENDYDNFAPSEVMLNAGQPIYLIYKGQSFLIDRNQQGNCLVESSYHRATDEEAVKIPSNNFDFCYVYCLSEEYIFRQIRM